MRIAILLAALAFMMPTGCTTVNNDNDADEVNDGDAHDENSGDCWDGERWVVVTHGHVHHPGCGHFFHHNAWHLHPVDFVYVGHNHHHFRVIVHHRHR